MKTVLLIIVSALVTVPTAAQSLEVSEIASMQISQGETLLPTESGWIVHHRKGLRVYSDNMEAVHKMSMKLNHRLTFSDAGSYFGVLKYNDNSPTTFSLLNVDVYSIAGKKLWSAGKPRASSVRLSDMSGKAVGIVGAEGFPSSDLYVYDEKGAVGCSLRVTHLIGVSFGPGGNSLFVNSSDSGLVAYDASGAATYRFGMARDFCVSADGEFVSTINPVGITFFKRGLRINSIAEAPDLVGSSLDMCFDSDASRLAILGINYIRIYRLPTLELICEVKPPLPNSRFSGFDSSGDGILAIGYDSPVKQINSTTHSTGGILLLDWDGALLHKMDLDYSDWSIGYPMVRMSSDGSSVKTATCNEAKLLQISR